MHVLCDLSTNRCSIVNSVHNFHLLPICTNFPHIAAVQEHLQVLSSEQSTKRPNANYRTTFFPLIQSNGNDFSQQHTQVKNNILTKECPSQITLESAQSEITSENSDVKSSCEICGFSGFLRSFASGGSINVLCSLWNSGSTFNFKLFRQCVRTGVRTSVISHRVSKDLCELFRSLKLTMLQGRKSMGMENKTNSNAVGDSHHSCIHVHLWTQQIQSSHTVRTHSVSHWYFMSTVADATYNVIEGDIILLSEEHLHFLMGLGVFLLAHVAYIIAFSIPPHDGCPRVQLHLARAVPFVALFAVIPTTLALKLLEHEKPGISVLLTLLKVLQTL